MCRTSALYVTAVRIKITAGPKYVSDVPILISARKNKITALRTLITAIRTLVTAFCTQISNSGSNNCAGGTKNNHSGTIFGVFRVTVCAGGTVGTPTSNSGCAGGTVARLADRNTCPTINSGCAGGTGCYALPFQGKDSGLSPFRGGVVI